MNPKGYLASIKTRALIVLIMLISSSNWGFSKNKLLINEEEIIDPIDQTYQSGPNWVKSELIKSGVLKKPNYNFTLEYDSGIIQTNIKGLFFEGLSYKGKNTQVFCWYGVPKNLPEGSKAPAVVLVHGGGGTAFPQWVKKWNDKGYIALAIALEGQIPGGKVDDGSGNLMYQTMPSSGPYRKGFFADVEEDNLKDQWFYHAVADVMLGVSLLKSFPEVDADKIGITGISWGGIITNVVTGIDDRFAFSIPVYGCGYLQETPLYNLQLSRLTNMAQAFYLENWEPSLYIPYQKAPTLFINGSNDLHFTMNSFTKSYTNSNTEKYLHIGYEMPHGHGPGWAPNEIYEFANYVLKNGVKPVSVLFKNVTNNNANFSYDGEVNLAKLYYTTDEKGWDYQAYKWMELPALFSKANKTINVDLPSDTKYFFINVQTPNNLVYSSAMEKNKL